MKSAAIEFKNQGGVLRGELFFPEGGELWPGAVLLHGFASDHREMVRAAQELATHSVAALVFDLRGHGQSGEVYAEDPVSDVLAAAMLLAHQPNVDAGRIALVGHSISGRLVLLATARDPSIAAVVALAPAADDGGAKLLAALDHLPPGPDCTVYHYPGDSPFPGMTPRRSVQATADMRRMGYRLAVDWTRLALSWVQQSVASVMNAIAPTPVLLVHCLWDDKVPLWHTLSLYRRARPSRGLMLSPWGVHSSPCRSALVRRMWTGWLGRALRVPVRRPVLQPARVYARRKRHRQ